MPISENSDPLEPRLNPDTGMLGKEQAVDQAGPGDGRGEFSDQEILTFLGEAKRMSRTYQQTVVMAEWEQSHSAYRGIHSSTSKYNKDQYKNRAKYFKPKTRSAVRKNMTATANALFSSRDVMACSAENNGDPMQLANAALIKELIDSRFNSKSRKSGVPWFQIAIGARFNAQVDGVICSKQSWSYKTRKKTQKVQEQQPVVGPDGHPLIDMSGQPMMQLVDAVKEVVDVLEDKPKIELIPSEMVLLDASAPWINPAQESSTLIIIWPMHVDDVKAMMDEEGASTPWRKVSDATLEGSYYSETEIMGIKAARDGNAATAARRSTSSFGGNRNEIVETWECFFRRGAIDYHCWTLKNQAMLSEAVPVEESYPHMRGSRPIVIGTDVLEPHVLYPTSHVASWKASQDEINDFSNLRMDASRQSVFPTAKVKAGKNIDYKAVQRRDGQGIILVREQDDVMWDRPPGPPPNVHEEVNLLSNDFDEIAGIFSQSSVQSNRQIGDTVGGMQLVSANANATSEFDLRCYIDTWAEPVLSQVVFLLQYYEDDANLLAVAGEKGKLFQKFQVDTITAELLESQVQIELNVGIGNSDPMQQLAKFKGVFDIAAPILQMAIHDGQAKVNYEEVFSEIFGKAGYRNGGDRFITVDPNGKPAIPPEAVDQLKQELDKLQQENQGLQQQLKDKGAQQQADLAVKQAGLASSHETKMAEIQATSQAKWNEALLTLLRDTIVAKIKAGTDTDSAMLDAKVETILGFISQGYEANQASVDAANQHVLDSQPKPVDGAPPPPPPPPVMAMPPAAPPVMAPKMMPSAPSPMGM